MKNVRLLHNPKAGEGNYSKEDLTKLLESKGYAVNYASVKEKGWDKLTGDKELLVVAGGDGAVGKVVKKLLKLPRAESDHMLSILPLGSANNFASSLGIQGKAHAVIDNWQHSKVGRIDLGKITADDEVQFFLESTGIGLIPLLMKKIAKFKKKNTAAIDTPEKKMESALDHLHQLVLSSKSSACEISADDKSYTGRYLLAEITNISTIGPRLCIAPKADATDGLLNMVLLSEHERESFAEYIKQLKNGSRASYPFKVLTAKAIEIRCEKAFAHIDDELSENKVTTLKASVLEGMLQFLLPNSSCTPSRT